MKKIVLLGVTIFSIFTLVACGSSGSTNSKNTKESSSTMTSKEKASSEAASKSESASSSAAEAAKEKATADAAAKEKADKKNPATYPQVAYDEMARNGDKHIGEKIEITGKVLQAMDSDDGGATLRVGTSEDGYDEIYLVTIDSDTWNSHRLLEDDNITIYGTVDGLESYDSTMGGKITKPEITAVFY